MLRTKLENLVYIIILKMLYVNQND